MRQPALKPLEIPTRELIYSDGEPLDSNWHRIQISLLIDVIGRTMAERQRTDFFAGGDMFVYFSLEQAQSIASDPTGKNLHFRGPGRLLRRRGGRPVRSEGLVRLGGGRPLPRSRGRAPVAVDRQG
jgi:hypothetical protein